MKLPKFKNYTGQPVKYIQPKMDGHMMHVTIDFKGNITVLSKNDKDKTKKLLNIKHISKQLCSLPKNTELFAELHCPDVYSTDIPTLLNNASPLLQLSVFACPLFDGKDLYYEDLCSVINTLLDNNMCVIPVELATRGFDCTYRARLLKDAIKCKMEGWVLKESHMEGWYKLKPTKTLDTVVTNYEISDSDTYKGCLKSVTLSIEGHCLGTCGTGFTKEFKLSINDVDSFESLIGKVCEIEYQSLTVNKKLQFPRFIRWRDDKDPDQCTINQLWDN